MSYLFCEICDNLCREYKEWIVDGEQKLLVFCEDCEVYYYETGVRVDKTLTKIEEIKEQITIEEDENRSLSKFKRSIIVSAPQKKKKRKSSRQKKRETTDYFHQDHLSDGKSFQIGLNHSINKGNLSLLSSSLDKEVTGFHIGDINIPLNAVSRDEIINYSLLDLIKLANISNEFDYKNKVKMKGYAQKFLYVSDYDFLLSLPTVHFTPYDFQISGPQKILGEMNGRAILADEVGLGKTLEAGIVIKELILREIITSCLILVPTSLKNQWEEELYEKFDLEFVVADSTKDLKKLLRTEKFIIASLYLFSRNKEELDDVKTDFLIVDEAHRLRNKGTNLYKAITRVKSDFRLLVTATPFQNNLSELYNLVNILRPGALGNWSQFRNRFIKTDLKADESRLNLLRGIVRKYVIRRRRKSLDLDIPARSARTMRLKANNAEEEIYGVTEDYITNIVMSDSSNLKGIKGLLLSSMLRRATSSPNAIGISFENALSNIDARIKDEVAKENLYGILENGIEKALEIANKANSSKLGAVFKELNTSDDQLIIFSEFKDTTYWLANELQVNGFDTIHFHGGLNSQKRFNLVKDFWEGKAQVFVSTDAGSEGLNLQIANRVMNYDLPWNPMRIEQRIGRVHRLTQKNPVEVINLVIDKSIEQRVLDRVLYKIGLFEDVIGGLDEIVGIITKTNLEKTEDALHYQILQNYVKSKSGKKSWDEFDSALDNLGNAAAKARDNFEDNANEIDGIIPLEEN